MFNKIKTSLKGRYVRIALYLMIANMLLAITKQSIAYYLDPKEFAGQFVTFLCSQLGMIFINAITLMILKYYRKEAFDQAFIKAIVKKIPFFIVLSLLLSFIQIGINLLCIPFSYIPSIYVILMNIVSTLFLLWNLMIVFQVMDGEQKIQVLLYTPITIVKAHGKTILAYSLPFLLWMIVGQQLLEVLLVTYVKDQDLFGNIFVSLMTYDTTSVRFIILSLYAAFYFIEFLCLIPLYMLTCIYYEETRPQQKTIEKEKRPIKLSIHK